MPDTHEGCRAALVFPLSSNWETAAAGEFWRTPTEPRLTHRLKVGIPSHRWSRSSAESEAWKEEGRSVSFNCGFTLASQSLNQFHTSGV
jgi:hypothetical protein